MKPAVKRTLIGLCVVLVGAQFFRPDRPNPPVDPQQTLEANLQVPDDALSLIERSCGDCHTHGTDWPWYSNVAPASWLVARHATHGREYVNFDRWGELTKYEAQDTLDEIAEVVESEEMPLPVYLPLHPEARMTEQERERLVTWATETRDVLRVEIDGSAAAESGDEHAGHDH